VDRAIDERFATSLRRASVSPLSRLRSHQNQESAIRPSPGQQTLSGWDTTRTFRILRGEMCQLAGWHSHSMRWDIVQMANRLVYHTGDKSMLYTR
jgi:hypothetical protein